MTAWTLVILAALDGYQAASVHTNYIDGFASKAACEEAVKAMKEPQRIYLRGYCVNKGDK